MVSLNLSTYTSQVEIEALKPEDIRNIVLVGHGSSGKTSMLEAILHTAGVTNRLGKISDGTCVLDFTEEEKERQHSMQTACCTVMHNGKQINFIDTPGAPDFCGQSVPALLAGDTAIIVISAAAGIEVNTRKMMERARDYGISVMIAVNKIDADGVNLEEVVEHIQESFGSQCTPVNLPTNNGKGVIRVIDGSGTPDFSDVAEARTAVVDAVVACDDDLMEKYLGGEVCEEEVRKFMPIAVAKGELTPIVFTCALDETGLDEFMDAIVNYAPSPITGKHRTLVNGEEETEIDPTGDDFVGQVFKVTSDEKTHIKYSYIRVFSGTIKSDTHMCTLREPKGMRPGAILRLMGGDHEELPEGNAGDIIALAKLDLKVGESVFVKTPGEITAPKLPAPMFAVAIEPKKPGDEDKVAAGFRRFAEEDPCFSVERNSVTHETVIHGISDVHVRTMFARLAKIYKVEVDTHPPTIAYRETITGSVNDIDYTHKKQSGGSGQYGKVVINMKANERGAGYEFVDKIFGGSIDQAYRSSVDKGVRAQMIEGVIAGYPVVDVIVELIDGKTHPVDSKDIAFQIAGKGAFREAFMKCKPILLEPIVLIEVTAPVDTLGDLQGDLASRRGQPIGQDMLPGQMAILKGKVPLSEVSDYHSRLSSITGGQGSYMLEYSHYEQVPSNVQQRVIEESKKDHTHAG